MACYDAEYVNKMSQIQKDELFPYQILASRNCQYILIRNPSSILSFYSVSNESIIQKWDINDNSIWSIYTSTDPQQMILSNNGCLTWSTQYDSVLTEICSVDPSLKYSTNNNTLTSVETERYSLQQLLNQQIIWLPLLLCITGAFCIILCFCANKICGNKLISNKRKGLTPIEELWSSNGSSSHVWIDSDEDNNSQKSNIDINDNDSKTQEICNYIDIEDNDNDDNKHDDDNIDNKFISQDVYDDGRGTQFISQDVYVATGIGTPAQSQLSDDNSGLDDENYALTIPEPKLSILRSDIQEI